MKENKFRTSKSLISNSQLIKNEKVQFMESILNQENKTEIQVPKPMFIYRQSSIEVDEPKIKIKKYNTTKFQENVIKNRREH